MNSILKACIASVAPFSAMVASQALRDNISEDMANFPYGVLSAVAVFVVGFISFKATNASVKAETKSEDSSKVKEVSLGIWIPAAMAAFAFIVSLWN